MLVSVSRTCENFILFSVGFATCKFFSSSNFGCTEKISDLFNHWMPGVLEAEKFGGLQLANPLSYCLIWNPSYTISVFQSEFYNNSLKYSLKLLISACSCLFIKHTLCPACDWIFRFVHKWTGLQKCSRIQYSSLFHCALKKRLIF